MGLYRYIAAAPGEKPQEMLIEADTPAEAQGKLRSRHLTLIRCCGEAGIGGKGLQFRSRINTFEFTRQLVPLLESSIPLERALSIIAESTAEPEQKQFVNTLRQGLHEGKRFSELIRGQGNLFPPYYANLIESGEESGTLPVAAAELYKFMGQNKELKEFVVSSSIYPAAIFGVTIAVTVLLFTVFVPRFAKIFSDMGRELPPSMNFLLGAGNFFSIVWWALPLAAAAVYYTLKQCWGEAELKRRISGGMLHLPCLGRILSDLEMCRYIRTLSILIGSHVEIIRTVQIAGRVIANPVVGESFNGISAKLKGGEKLSAALRGNPYIPHEMIPMLRIGEESGSVGGMLERIAVNLEGDTRTKIKRLLSLFEPAVIIFLALLVLVVVVSIFVAMMEINSINQGGSSL